VTIFPAGSRDCRLVLLAGPCACASAFPAGGRGPSSRARAFRRPAVVEQRHWCIPPRQGLGERRQLLELTRVVDVSGQATTSGVSQLASVRSGRKGLKKISGEIAWTRSSSARRFLFPRPRRGRSTRPSPGRPARRLIGTRAATRAHRASASGPGPRRKPARRAAPPGGPPGRATGRPTRPLPLDDGAGGCPSREPGHNHRRRRPARRGLSRAGRRMNGPKGMITRELPCGPWGCYPILNRACDNKMYASALRIQWSDKESFAQASGSLPRFDLLISDARARNGAPNMAKSKAERFSTRWALPSSGASPLPKFHHPGRFARAPVPPQGYRSDDGGTG